MRHVLFSSKTKLLIHGQFDPVAIRVREIHRVSVCLSFSELSIYIQSGSRLPRLYALVSAFVCTDKACPWESREAWGPHLLGFRLVETSL